jgi:hypothetical protein
MSKISLTSIPEGYRSQAEDTNIDIDLLQFQRWREMSLSQKARLITGATQGCRQLSLMGIKNQYPDANYQQQRYLYTLRILGEDWGSLVKTWNINQKIMIGNPIELALLIAEIFDSLEIAYFVGGSVASSLWGESRATLDVDVVANLKLGQVDEFINLVKSLFYVSEDAVKTAISNQSSFNLIHFDTNEKIDIFLLNQTPLAQIEMERKCLQELELGRCLYLASPEDIIIQKLIWYRAGNQISDRQWRDILGVLKTQSNRLDFDYLHHWSKMENLSPLLHKALVESGLNSESRD